MAAVFRLSSLDFTQMEYRSILALLDKWREIWAAVDTKHMRLVARTTPLSMDEPIKHARRRKAEAEDRLAEDHLHAYAGMLSQAASQRAMFGYEHYLVLPAFDRHSEAQAVFKQWVSGMGLNGVPATDLPCLLPTRYRTDENPTMLVPMVGGYPLLSVLVSYDVTGEWSHNALLEILRRPGIAMSIDVKTHRRGEAFKRLDKVQTVQEGLITQFGAKAALQRQHNAYQQIMSGISAGDALHQVCIAVLVAGRTQDELRQREEDVKSDAAGNLSLRRLDGKMADAFRHFFTSQKGEIPGRLYRNVTSKGMAVVSGALGTRGRSDTDGVLWGFSGSSPFFWDGFGPKINEPNHAVILGQTGSGKTTSIFSVALREMNLRDTQVIVMEPMGNCQHLVRAVGEERSSYNPLRLAELRINPTEMIYDNLAEQKAHLSIIVPLLLGRAGERLSEAEQAAVERAAGLIYEGVTPDTPPINQPRIETLVWALQNSGAKRRIAEASEWVGELLEERYVRGALGDVFNTPTLNDWRLSEDLVAFDFKGIPDEQGLRSMLYYLVLSTIHREAYRQKRKRRRLVIIDEFRVLSEHPTLANKVAEMFKTFRTLGVGVWALEQDLVTFIGAGRVGANMENTKAGIHIIDNSTIQVILAQRAVQGETMLPEVLPQLTPDHVSMVTSLAPFKTDRDKGRGLIVQSNAVYPIKFYLTPHELAVLGGT